MVNLHDLAAASKKRKTTSSSAPSSEGGSSAGAGNSSQVRTKQTPTGGRPGKDAKKLKAAIGPDADFIDLESAPLSGGVKSEPMPFTDQYSVLENATFATRRARLMATDYDRSTLNQVPAEVLASSALGLLAQAMVYVGQFANHADAVTTYLVEKEDVLKAVTNAAEKVKLERERAEAAEKRSAEIQAEVEAWKGKEASWEQERELERQEKETLQVKLTSALAEIEKLRSSPPEGFDAEALRREAVETWKKGPEFIEECSQSYDIGFANFRDNFQALYPEAERVVRAVYPDFTFDGVPQGELTPPVGGGAEGEPEAGAAGEAEVGKQP